MYLQGIRDTIDDIKVEEREYFHILFKFTEMPEKKQTKETLLLYLHGCSHGASSKC